MSDDTFSSYGPSFGGVRDLSKSKEDRAVRMIARHFNQPISRKRRLIAHSMAGHTDATQSGVSGNMTEVLDKAKPVGRHAEEAKTKELSSWIERRQQDHKKLDSIGLNKTWLQNKIRCPIEEQAYRKASEHAHTTSPTPAHDRLVRRTSSTYIARKPAFQNELDLANQWSGMDSSPSRSSIDLGEGTSARDGGGQFCTFGTALPTNLENSYHTLQRFVTVNRWRLHDLFARCGITDNYMMTIDEMASLLERAGRIIPVDFALRNSVAFDKAIHCEGTLAPVTSRQLREILTWLGPDRHGMLDYRVLLDDHRSQNTLAQLQRYDRNRRRRNPHLPSVHESIAQSIRKNDDPLAWLHKVGHSERAREERVSRAIETARTRRLDTKSPDTVGMVTPNRTAGQDAVSPHVRRWQYSCVPPQPDPLWVKRDDTLPSVKIGEQQP